MHAALGSPAHGTATHVHNLRLLLLQVTAGVHNVRAVVRMRSTLPVTHGCRTQQLPRCMASRCRPCRKPLLLPPCTALTKKKHQPTHAAAYNSATSAALGNPPLAQPLLSPDGILLLSFLLLVRVA